MTQQEIEKAAALRTENCLKPTIARHEFNGFIAGAEMVNSKQPYSAEDMKLFIKWSRPKWYLYLNKSVSDDEILKLWEESKNG